MKIVLITLTSFLIFCKVALAQIPNAGFENWVPFSTYEDPEAPWTTANSLLNQLGIPPTVNKSTDAHSGTYAMELSTVSSVYIVSGLAICGNILSSPFSANPYGGIPFTERPQTFRCFYKYVSGNGTDSFHISSLLWKWNGIARDTIALVDKKYGAANVYTLFNEPFQYMNGQHPDSMNIFISSSYVTNAPQPGTVLLIDDLSFHGTVGSGTSYYVFVSANQPNCSNNGSLTATAFNGTTPYTYLWSNGATDSTITGLGAGTYTVTVTDSSGLVTVGTFSLYAPCINVLQGTVFNDANGNCAMDTLETPVLNAYVEAANGSNLTYYGTADSAGHYSISIPVAGTFTISATTWSNGYGNCGNLTVCNSNTVTFPSVGDTSSGNNFSSSPGSSHDLGIYATWSATTPGYQMQYNLYPYDFSVAQFVGLVPLIFHYDSNLVFQSSNNAQVVNNSATHSISRIGAGMPTSIFGEDPIICYFHVPVTVPADYELQSDFYINPVTNDCDTTNNHLHTSATVGHIDGHNNKTVSPEGNITADDSVLTYTIHFQNTGTDTSHFVIITDTLSASLNPTTLVILASSAPFSEFTLSGNGIARWVFNPLLLPDSITNAPGSKGFIQFKIKVKPNLPVGTQINNTASIYFDYNIPVLTNTASNSIISGIAQVSDGSGQLSVFPNPANEELTVSSNKQIMNEIVVSDVLGKVIYSGKSNQKSQIINLKSFENGVYFLKVQLQSGEVVVRRFVKE